MDLYAYMTDLKNEGGEVCLSDIQFNGCNQISEKRYIVVDFTEKWIRIVHEPGEQSFHFICIESIAACNVTNNKRRKSKRE
jgi:hypothetical protein